MKVTRSSTNVAALALACAVLAALVSCSRTITPTYRTFPSPEDAVKALIDAAKKGVLEEILAIFGPAGTDLVDTSDPATVRQNRQVFVAAAAERWSLVDQANNTKTLVIGNEDWPFPVPLARDTNGWHFDAAAGKEEVLARRIGRNELAVIRICGTYVAAQKLYAVNGHDGQPPGLYAQKVRSDPGRQDGLYWPTERGQKRSPLGDLVAQAAAEGRALGKDGQPAPFHGYYFKILTGQGAAAPGGAKSYVADGRMSGGFALIAWPAQYDVTGVMTFIVSQDGTVRERDLGPDTANVAGAMALYNPDASWTAAQ